MKKRWRAWFAAAVTAALFLLLVFFSLAGDSIYQWVTPKVPVFSLKGLIERDGNRYARLPGSALTAEDCVYTVTASQGFSRTIYQIWKVEVEYIEDSYDASMVLVSTKLPQNCMVVTQPEKAEGLADGDQVLPQR